VGGKKDEKLSTNEVIKHAFGNIFLRVITQEQTLIKDIYKSNWQFQTTFN
jgi:hypothetical protein